MAEIPPGSSFTGHLVACESVSEIHGAPLDTVQAGMSCSSRSVESLVWAGSSDLCRSTDFLRQVVSEKGRGWSAPTMVNKEDNTQHEWRCLRNAKRLAEAEPPAHAANWRHSQGPDGISGVQCALSECDDMIVALKLITYLVKRKQFRCGAQLDRQQVGGSAGNFHFGGQGQSLGHNG